MFRKIKPNERVVINEIGQFPHCDSRVLHAPLECEYCDMHPEWQALRQAWGIAFTGYEPEQKELPDPATHARGLNTVHAWSGNAPRPRETPETRCGS